MKARRVLSVVKRNAYETRHSVAEIFDYTYWPFFDLLAWGLLASYIEAGDVELPVPVAFLLGGALLWNVLYRVQNGIAMAFMVETWTDNAIMLFASPITPGEFLAGALVWTGVVAVYQTAIMTLLALVVFQFGLLSIGPALVPFMAALIVFAAAMGLVILGLQLRVGHGANAWAWGLAGVVQPLSAVYYPVEVLPGWAQQVAWWLPASHIFEGMRAVMDGQPIPWGQVQAAFALDALYLALATWFCHRMFQTLRRRGFVTRYA